MFTVHLHVTSYTCVTESHSYILKNYRKRCGFYACTATIVVLFLFCYNYRTLQISAPSSLTAHTLRMFLILPLRAESGRNESPLAHSATSRLAILVGQSGLTLTNSQSRVKDGAVITQF